MGNSVNLEKIATNYRLNADFTDPPACNGMIFGQYNDIPTN